MSNINPLVGLVGRSLHIKGKGAQSATMEQQSNTAAE